MFDGMYDCTVHAVYSPNRTIKYVNSTVLAIMDAMCGILKAPSEIAALREHVHVLQGCIVVA